MTTIAYSVKDSLIAVDGRETLGNTIVSDKVNKIIKNEHGSFILCGNTADSVLFSEGGFADDQEYDCGGLWVKPDGEVVGVYGGGNDLCPVEFNEAFGSGASFALSAMDFGKSAKEAVKYASTRDCKTGGAIRTLRV